MAGRFSRAARQILLGLLGREHSVPVRQKLLYQLDPRAPVARYRQIYARVRAGIADGTLRPAQRLPSAGALTSQLAVARGTVDAAYSLLADEGYIEARGAAGTVVAPALVTLRPPLPPSPSQGAQALRTRQTPAAVEERALRAFQLGCLHSMHFRCACGRISGCCARQWPTSAMVPQSPFGYRPLRGAIAAYLAGARGIACTRNRWSSPVASRPPWAWSHAHCYAAGMQVWVEDPGYFYARNAVLAAGGRAVPIPVDAQGIDVSAGCVRAPQARLAVVTPSHQAPLGMTLELTRRLALLACAKQTQA